MDSEEEKSPRLRYPLSIINYPLPPSRPTHVRYWVMLCLCVLSFLTYFDRSFITRIQGTIQHDLIISDTQMGFIFSAFWLAYALFELPGGWLGDRFGARGTLVRVVLAWSLFTALSGSAVGFISLLACRFLFGVGEAGAYPNIDRVQAKWFPASSRGMASGLLWLVARWGAAFSPLLFGALMRLLASKGFQSAISRFPAAQQLASVPVWRMAFWACGIIGIAWAVFFWAWFRDDPADKPSVNAAELLLITNGRIQRKRERQDRKVWAALFSSPSLWGLAFVYVFGSFGFSFFLSWMPRFLKSVHHIDYDKSEWMSALPMFCAGIASVVGGWISDRLVARTGRKRFARALLPVAGSLFAAVAIFGLRYAQTPHQAVALMCITMAAYDIGLGAKWAAIIDVGGAHSGIASGFVNMLGNLGGNFLQPFIGAAIFTHFGWPTLFAVYAITYVLAAAMWLFIEPDKQFYEEAESPAPRGFPVDIR
jgi:ACS family glucarate transporter-like MFS transporter